MSTEAKAMFLGRRFFLAAASGACLFATDIFAADSNPGLEVYGFAQVDYVQDFRRVNPAWDDTLRPSKIPVAPGEYGSDGQAVISARQSRLGVKSTLPVDGSDLATKFEFDLFGVGVDEGKTTLRLRHAYGEWRQFLGGQTHSLFMDVDIFPNVFDYWGPAGMVFLRNPQVRWTPLSGPLSAALAIEKPSNDIDPGRIRDVAPEFGDNLQNDEKIPDLTGQVRVKGDWGHFQAAGILRRVGYETLGTSDNRPRDFKLGWGFNVTSVLNFLKQDKLLLGVVYGHGIASYMNDGGTDLAPEGTRPALQASALPLLGVSVYVDHYWSDKWSTSLGYSRTQVENRSFQAGSAFYKGEYASINLIHAPGKNMFVGGELLWGRRMNNDDSQNSDVRSQISFKYNFSTQDFPITL